MEKRGKSIYIFFLHRYDIACERGTYPALRAPFSVLCILYVILYNIYSFYKNSTINVNLFVWGVGSGE